jgi:hypothetical protein
VQLVTITVGLPLLLASAVVAWVEVVVVANSQVYPVAEVWEAEAWVVVAFSVAGRVAFLVKVTRIFKAFLSNLGLTSGNKRRLRGWRGCGSAFGMIKRLGILRNVTVN